MMITMDHVRHVYYCSTGLKIFFRKYNLDLREFCNRGLDESLILGTGDEMAIHLVEEARKWEAARMSKQ